MTDCGFDIVLTWNAFVSAHTPEGLSFSDGKIADNEDFKGSVKAFAFADNGTRIAWIKSGQ